MRLATLIDPACFIWDENDFYENMHIYYDVIDGIMDLLSTLEEEELAYILSTDMIDILIESFPAKIISEEIKIAGITEVINLFFSFISKVPDSLIVFNSNPVDATSEPNLSKQYFSELLKAEVELIINHLATYSEDLVVVSLEGVWSGDDNKISILDKGSSLELKNLEVLVNGEKLKTEIDKRGVFFEPSKKHMSLGGWGTILSPELEEECYTLIKESVKINENSDARYAYSEKHDEFIIFRLTVNNIYHAYPIPIDAVPNDIIKLVKGDV
ncbi:hypothetical protein BHE17_04705 [Planococcus maritimus]|uniref:hypothetical protein n=1 Tax=Planococcus maritimus TaxID=192421 RepID=UPI00084CA52F|nr:hypothetical protein [Planococcus maritimus]OED31776.1 hypothetical protein BHE17_04705 [Planococcus maritimus]